MTNNGPKIIIFLNMTVTHMKTVNRNETVANISL